MNAASSLPVDESKVCSAKGGVVLLLTPRSIGEISGI